MGKRIMVGALLLFACRRPLEPGETRCTTNNAFGTLVTNCETGQEEKPVPPPGWWCSYQGDYGICFRGPGECEVGRARYSSGGAPGTGYGACAFQQTAICATTCFGNPFSCATFERNNGRDGMSCRAFQ